MPSTSLLLALPSAAASILGVGGWVGMDGLNCTVSVEWRRACLCGGWVNKGAS